MQGAQVRTYAAGTLIRVTTCWPIAVRHANACRSHCHTRGPLPRGRTGLFAASLEASAAAFSSAAFCSAAFLAAMAAFREEEADILEAPGEPNLAGDDMALWDRDGTDWHGRCCCRRITVALAGCHSRLSAMSHAQASSTPSHTYCALRRQRIRCTCTLSFRSCCNVYRSTNAAVAASEGLVHSAWVDPWPENRQRFIRQRIPGRQQAQRPACGDKGAL